MNAQWVEESIAALLLLLAFAGIVIVGMGTCL